MTSTVSHPRPDNFYPTNTDLLAKNLNIRLFTEKLCLVRLTPIQFSTLKKFSYLISFFLYKFNYNSLTQFFTTTLARYTLIYKLHTKSFSHLVQISSFRGVSANPHPYLKISTVVNLYNENREKQVLQTKAKNANFEVSANFLPRSRYSSFFFLLQFA